MEGYVPQTVDYFSYNYKSYEQFKAKYALTDKCIGKGESGSVFMGYLIDCPEAEVAIKVIEIEGIRDKIHLLNQEI